MRTWLRLADGLYEFSLCSTINVGRLACGDMENLSLLLVASVTQRPDVAADVN